MIRRVGWADGLVAASAVFFLAMAGTRLLGPRAAPAPEAPMLVAGEEIPAFWNDLGVPDAPKGPTLAIFLTSECPFCRISVVPWNDLATDVLARPGGTVAGVSLSDAESTASYPEETGLTYPLHQPRDREALQRRWKVPAVPYTVLLDSRGRVEGAWRGAVDAAMLKEIRGRLGPPTQAAPDSPTSPP